MTETDFAAAGKTIGLKDKGMTVTGDGAWKDLTATEGVTTFGTALGAERVEFKPRPEFGVRTALADGSDISILTGAPELILPVVPTVVLIWATA